MSAILGGILGGSSGSGLLGGVLSFFGGRPRARRQREAEMQKFVRLREAAKLGGFHPLEALRSGATVEAPQGPSLLSSLAQNNAFDALADEITGEGAKRRQRQQVQDEIAERELEILQQETARGTINNPTVVTNRPPKLAPTTHTDNPGSIDFGGGFARPDMSPTNPQPEPEEGVGLPNQATERGRETVTNPNSTDSQTRVNPLNKDAETWEARYSDLVAAIAGVGNLIGDREYDTLLKNAAHLHGGTEDSWHARILANPELLSKLRTKPRKKPPTSNWRFGIGDFNYSDAPLNFGRFGTHN